MSNKISFRRYLYHLQRNPLLQRISGSHIDDDCARVSAVHLPRGVGRQTALHQLPRTDLVCAMQTTHSDVSPSSSLLRLERDSCKMTCKQNCHPVLTQRENGVSADPRDTGSRI